MRVNRILASTPSTFTELAESYADVLLAKERARVAGKALKLRGRFAELAEIRPALFGIVRRLVARYHDLVGLNPRTS